MLRRHIALAATLAAACSSTPEQPDTATTTATTGSADAGATIPGDTTSPTTTAATPTTSTDESTSTGTTGSEPAIDYNQQGPHPVGNDRFTMQVGDRSMLVEVWYPAIASAAAAAKAGHPIEDFVPAGPDHDTLTMLLAELSPAGHIGTRLQTSSAFAATPVTNGSWPLIVFSHCHNCVRFSAFTVAERLASHGFMVAAPDHTGNTLFDPGADIGEDFLVVRVGDIKATIDVLLSDAEPLPAALRGLSDPDHIGALGHSFGAATAGRVAQDDPRIRAAMPIAAPVENPIFPGTHLADIDVPMLSVLAMEDNSIGQIGNNVLKMNFMNANPPVRLLSVADAGHWGFTDICGLTMGFSAGCGDGVRQTKAGEMFTYLDIAVGREIASAYSLAFFDRYLRDNTDAASFLDAATPADVVTVDVRE